MMKRGWNTFNFGLENENPKAKKTCTKVVKKMLEKPTLRNCVHFFNFERQLEPKSTSELAVHPKKLQEVEAWLKEFALKTNLNRNSCPVLLISGPTGSGKTTTVKVICQQNNIKVSEWFTPIDQDFELNKCGGQVTRFTEFLIDSKYGSLLDYGTERENWKQITLIRDFPNALIQDPQAFFNIMEEYFPRIQTPIVFICTNSTNNKVDLIKTLFPENIIVKNRICHIEFNPCASTILKTALKRAQNLAHKNPDLFKALSSNTIEAIISSSMGDIRTAIKQFHLASLIGSSEIPTESMEIKSKTKGKKKNSSKLKSLSCDQPLGLFHGLGRVFNPKPSESKKAIWNFEHDVGQLIDEFSSFPYSILSLLQENYLNYFGDLYDVTCASEFLSFGQDLLSKWNESNHSLEFALWTTVVGLMLSNKHRVSKWNPIRGAKKFEKREQANGRTLSPLDYSYFNRINQTDKYSLLKLK